MGAISLDRSRWPVVISEYPDRYSAPELRAYFVEVRALLKEGRRHVMLQDMRRGMSPDAESRELGAAFLRETNEATKAVCAATVFVVSNKIMKLALQGVFALQRPATPFVIVDSREEADQLAAQKAAEAGLGGRVDLPAKR
jgi:hypothetical protein